MSRRPSSPGRRAAWVVAGIALVGLALRLAVAARPIAVLDRLFIPDDTYYTLTIARSIARGHGPTADGSTLTSGFQPLLGFLMVPVYWLTHNLDRALRADVLLLAVADAITTALVARIAYRVAGGVAAVVSAAVWAVSPVAIAMAVGGLETSLAMTLEAGLLVAWMWANEDPGRARFAIVGVVAGLAVLGRIDAIALVGLLAAVQFWRGSWRQLVPTAAAGAVVLAPWWLWCWVNLGTPFPTSGSAAHALAGGASWAATTFASAGGAVVGGPFTGWLGLRTQLVDHPARGVLVFVVVVAGLLVIGAMWSGRDDAGSAGGPSARQLAATLPVFAAVLMVFYVWFGVTYYLNRYLAPVALVATLLLGVGAATVVRWASARGARRVVVGVAGAALLVAMGVAVVADVHDLTDDDRVASALDAATGFAATRRNINDIVPRGAVVGAWQSGALGYYGDDRITVVNLDGVVNPEAPPQSDSAATARYLRRRRAGWLADWELFMIKWQLTGAAKLRPPPRFRTVVSVPAWPGSDRIYAVWQQVAPTP